MLIRHYAPYLGRMRPLPGAAALLHAIARLGLAVVLATSAKDDEVGLMLDALGAIEVYDDPAALLGGLRASPIGRLGPG